MKLLKHPISSIVLITALLSLTGCQQDEPDLPTVEARVKEATEELRAELTAPANGWRVNYRPTPEAGTYLMLMKFDEDGSVRIQSDVSGEEAGEFYDDSITYRIDVGAGLELIFETYGVLHFLYEQEQSLFGAEFEFFYLRKEGNDLHFLSKTDDVASGITFMTMTPAGTNDAALFDRDLVDNLNQFGGLSPQIFGSTPPIQQVIFNDHNISLFWSIDLLRRIIDVDVAGIGTTLEEVSSAGKVSIGHATGFSIESGKLILQEPFGFSVGGNDFTISEISLNTFNPTGGPSFCDLAPENTPSHEGQIQGVGSVTVLKSLYDSNGEGFQPISDNLYSVNIPFIFDDSLRSLQEEGSIATYFPDAVGFLMTYGFESDSIPAYGLGFILEDSLDNVEFFLREYDTTSTVGNRVELTLNNSFYHSGNTSPELEANLAAVTDEIFEGGVVYAYDLGIEGLTVFRLFNPCNRYEVFLVQ